MSIGKAEEIDFSIAGEEGDRVVVPRNAVHDGPVIVELGTVKKLTGKGRLYQDGRKYDERQ